MKRIEVYTVQLVRESAKLYDLDEKIIRSPESAYKAVEEIFQLSSLPNEHFGILTLNTKNHVAGAHLIFSGSLNSSIVHPREVFQRAILNNAASILCFHNHPSGDPVPSREDVEVTHRLQDAGQLLGIELLDHIIACRDLFYSLKEKGHFK